MNFRTSIRKLREMMVRDPLPPSRVAAGWAIGMFVGCTVPFGLQLLVSVPLSFIFKVSKIGATVGTLITNPVSIFFIYPAQTWVGARLLGYSFSWEYIAGVCERLQQISLLSREGWTLLASISGQVLAGFFVGGFLLALICTPPTYFFVRHIVRHRRR